MANDTDNTIRVTPPMPAHRLAEADFLAHDAVRPFSWRAEHMSTDHYDIASDAMDILPDLHAEILRLRAEEASALAEIERLRDVVRDAAALLEAKSDRGARLEWAKTIRARGERP